MLRFIRKRAAGKLWNQIYFDQIDSTYSFFSNIKSKAKEYKLLITAIYAPSRYLALAYYSSQNEMHHYVLHLQTLNRV